MDVNEIMKQCGITKYKLAKKGGIPYTTINDICSGKTRIERCSGETLYKLSKTLGVSMEELVEDSMKGGASILANYGFRDMIQAPLCNPALFGNNG